MRFEVFLAMNIPTALSCSCNTMWSGNWISVLQRQHVPLKCWYSLTWVHSVTARRREEDHCLNIKPLLSKYSHIHNALNFKTLGIIKQTKCVCLVFISSINYTG
jgi:hypothetical protein